MNFIIIPIWLTILFCLNFIKNNEREVKNHIHRMIYLLNQGTTIKLIIYQYVYFDYIYYYQDYQLIYLLFFHVLVLI